MQLHKDIELFNEIVEKASENLKISEEIIRKDYFVSLFLKAYKKVEPELVFKGGTSLSKCYGAVKRFSEDIDISFYNDGDALTEGERRRINYHVRDACKELDYTIMNLDEIKSRRNFNQYRVDTGFMNDSMAVRDSIIVEIALQTLTFPVELKFVDMYIFDYLNDNELDEIIKEYELEPFQIYAQDKVRTFIDKVFAVCDYHLEGNYEEHSRHIYDLYKLWPNVKYNIEKNLINEVRAVRGALKYCPSATEGISLNDLLVEIVSDEVYKEDYEKITSTLLFEEVAYKEAILVLTEISNSGLFR